MPSKKISEFLMLTTPSGLEQTVVAIGGVNHRVTLNAIKSLITKNDLGLDLVNNTSDADKPISTATQAALTGKSNMGHTHAMADVPGLVQYITDQLAILAATLSVAGHTHQINEISGLVTALSGKANVADLNSLATVVTNINTAMGGKASTVHTHTTADITGLGAYVADQIVNKSNVGHSHTANEITGLTAFVQALITNAIASFSSVGHTHEISEINNLTATLSDKANSSDVTALGTLITALQTTVAGKANASHQHSVTDLLNFASEVQAIVSAMNLASVAHTHTAAQVTDFNAALSVIMRDVDTFMNATSGMHDVLPHAHTAAQIQELQSAITSELTIPNLQTQVETIVNAMGLGGVLNAVTIGDIQW
jgi:Phage tail repeat like